VNFTFRGEAASARSAMAVAPLSSPTFGAGTLPHRVLPRGFSEVSGVAYDGAGATGVSTLFTVEDALCVGEYPIITFEKQVLNMIGNLV
jgi:hypothetical protein